MSPASKRRLMDPIARRLATGLLPDPIQLPDSPSGILFRHHTPTVSRRAVALEERTNRPSPASQSAKPRRSLAATLHRSTLRTTATISVGNAANALVDDFNQPGRSVRSSEARQFERRKQTLNQISCGIRQHQSRVQHERTSECDSPRLGFNFTVRRRTYAYGCTTIAESFAAALARSHLDPHALVRFSNDGHQFFADGRHLPQ